MREFEKQLQWQMRELESMKQEIGGGGGGQRWGVPGTWLWTLPGSIISTRPIFILPGKFQSAECLQSGHNSGGILNQK